MRLNLSSVLKNGIWMETWLYKISHVQRQEHEGFLWTEEFKTLCICPGFKMEISRTSELEGNLEFRDGDFQT